MGRLGLPADCQLTCQVQQPIEPIDAHADGLAHTARGASGRELRLGDDSSASRIGWWRSWGRSGRYLLLLGCFFARAAAKFQRQTLDIHSGRAALDDRVD